jgi:hypothetical protein
MQTLTSNTSRGPKRREPLRLRGIPVNLNAYEAPSFLTNNQFRDFNVPEFERFYLSDSMNPLIDQDALEAREFIVDDNRGAVSPTPMLDMDGTEFYLSVKGIGSTTSPFSDRLLGKTEVSSVLDDPGLRQKVLDSEEKIPRFVTGELWLRGSPYGGQGLQHAITSMRVSEMADLTSIHGFRIAPIVKIVMLPEKLEAEIKKIFWYRRFGGRIVQEIRLVPSNVRIYFHSGSTIGSNIGSVFDLFGIDSNDSALNFLKNFVMSGVAFLTLFTRSITRSEDDTFMGLDYSDVWLDKDAVLAPDGTIYFVDLEGLETITVGKARVQEKIEDQIYRSLYEFIYAYEQIERERAARFGDMADRKAQFEYLLREALKNDEMVGLNRAGGSLQLLIGNALKDQSISCKFPIIDW